jgi:hypothetical protein
MNQAVKLSPGRKFKKKSLKKKEQNIFPLLTSIPILKYGIQTIN